MLEKKNESINPLKGAVVGKARKIDFANHQRERAVDNKKRAKDAGPKWYTGRINPSHEGMIW